MLSRQRFSTFPWVWSYLDWRPRPELGSSNDIPRRSRRSRMHKLEREPRSRGARNTRIRGGVSSLRFVGIDVAAERHVVAVVDETGTILLRVTPVTEDTPGYRQLLERMCCNFGGRV